MKSSHLMMNQDSLGFLRSRTSLSPDALVALYLFQWFSSFLIKYRYNITIRKIALQHLQPLIKGDSFPCWEGFYCTLYQPKLLPDFWHKGQPLLLGKSLFLQQSKNHPKSSLPLSRSISFQGWTNINRYSDSVAMRLRCLYLSRHSTSSIRWFRSTNHIQLFTIDGAQFSQNTFVALLDHGWITSIKTVYISVKRTKRSACTIAAAWALSVSYLRRAHQ